MDSDIPVLSFIILQIQTHDSSYHSLLTFYVSQNYQEFTEAISKEENFLVNLGFDPELKLFLK